MEAILTWLFPSSHRVPTGRAPSFTNPIVPIPAARTLPPKGALACPLPPHRTHHTHPSATVGWHVDDWAQHSARYITNARGQRIFVQTWRPHVSNLERGVTGVVMRLLGKPRKERGVVYIVHGLNDHSNKYTRVAKAWVNAGYVVVAHDFHGHGRSDGYRAYTSSMQHYVDDAKHAILDSDRQFPRRIATLPKFLLAHSLGGAVAIHLARDSPKFFRGVMLTAPAVKVYPKPILKLLAPILGTLAPLLPVQRLKFDRRKRRNAAHDQDGDYCPHDDPLVVRSPVRARVGYEVLKSCQKIMSEADRFRVALFVAHSREDRVTNAKGTVEFHDRIASRDKTVRLYDGSVHDLLAEKREVVMSDMVAWADKRL